jgi:hypothetical protein
MSHAATTAVPAARRKRVGLFGWVGILLLTAAVLALDYAYARAIAFQIRAWSFPSVDGQMYDARVKSKPGSRKTAPTYWAVVRYIYLVDHKAYTGRDVRRSLVTGTGPDTPKKIVAAYPEGSTVRVYYDPASPGDAVLEPGVGGPDLFTLLLVLPANLVLAGAWRVGYASLGRRDMPAKSPAGAAALPAVWASLALWVGVGAFWSPMDSSTPGMLIALGIVGAVAVRGWSKRRGVRITGEGGQNTGA